MTLDLTLFRHRLAEEAARLDDALAQAGNFASTVTLDQSSVGRLSRMDALQQQAMAKGFQERLLTRKRAVQAALDQIDAGTPSVNVAYTIRHWSRSASNRIPRRFSAWNADRSDSRYAKHATPDLTQWDEAPLLACTPDKA